MGLFLLSQQLFPRRYALCGDYLFFPFSSAAFSALIEIAIKQMSYM